MRLEQKIGSRKVTDPIYPFLVDATNWSPPDTNLANQKTSLEILTLEPERNGSIPFLVVKLCYVNLGDLSLLKALRVRENKF